MPGVFLVVLLLLAGVGFGAIKLNGTSQYGTIDDADACPESGEDFWLTVWFKRDGAPSTAGMIVGWTEGGVNDSLCNIRMNTSGKITFGIRPDGGSLSNQSVSAAVVTDGNWHCVTIWRSGSTLNALVDNVTRAYSYNLTGTLTLTRLCIGVQVRSGVDSSLYWAGEVAEVMVGRGTIDEATARALYNLGYPKRGQAPSTLYRRWPLTSDANASGGAGPNFTLTGEPTYADDSAFFSAIDGFTPAAISRSAPAIVLENDLESATSHRQAVTVSSSGWGLVSFVHNNADPNSAGATVTVQAAGAKNRATTASASGYVNRLSEYVENAADLFTFPFAGTFMTQVSVDAPAELKGVAVRFEPDYGVIPLYGHSFHCDPTRIVHLGDTWQVYTGMDVRGAVSITKNGTVLFTDYSAAVSRNGDDVYHMGSVLAPMPAGVAVFITEHNGEIKVAYIADDGSTTSLAWADVVSSGGDATYARVVADDAGTVYVLTRGTQDGSNGSGCAVYHVSDIPTGTPTVVYDQLGHDGFRQYPTHIELTDGLIAMAWTGAWSYGFAAVYDVSADKWYDLSKTQRGGNSKGDDTTPRFDATEWTTTQAAGTGLRIYGGSNSTYLATAIFDLTDWTNTHGAAAFLFSESAGSINEYATTTMRWVIQDGANTYVSGTDFDQPADWTCNSWRVFAKALWKDDDPTTGIAYLVMIDHDDREAGGNYDTALPTGYTPYYDMGGRRIRVYKITNPTDYTAITFTLVETVSVTGSDDLTAGFVRSVPGSANTFTWQEAVNELTEFKRQTDDVLYEFPSGGAALTINVEPGTSHAVGRDTWFYATGYQGTDSTFVWDFGDGWTGQGIIPLHRYRFPGVYTVTLTETDASLNEYVATETVTITGTAREVGPKAAGPVVWYKFEGNGNDSSGNDLHGTVTGAAYAAGVSGSCLDTTSGAYMTVGDDDALDGFANGMTISFWAKASDSQLLEYVVQKRNSYHAYFAYYSPLYTANAFFYTAGGSTSTRARSSTPFCDGRWRHFLFVYNYGDQNVDSVDPNYMAVYVDGLLHIWTDASGSPREHTAPGPVAATDNDLYIGRNATGSYPFLGYIDDLMIWDRPLSVDEITSAFRIEGAPAINRSAQYLYIKVPTLWQADPTNTLTVTITGPGTSTNDTLVNAKANLALTETVLVPWSSYDADLYTITATLKTSGGVTIATDYFYYDKKYDGAPTHLYLDEHNRFHLPYGADDGSDPIFPFTVWIPQSLPSTDIDLYEPVTDIGLGYNSATGMTWEHQLNFYGDNTPSIPSIGRSIRGLGVNVTTADLAGFLPSAMTLTDDAYLQAYWLLDEPTVLDPDYPPEIVAGARYYYHQQDGTRLTFTNHEGRQALLDKAIQPYMYRYSPLGYLGSINDSTGFDLYPIDWTETVAEFVECFDWMDYYEPYIPCIPFVEIGTVDTPGPPPTDAQVRMLSWLSIIKGAKGIHWFQHHDRYNANYAGARAVYTEVKALESVILADPTTKTVADNQATIESTIREEADGTLWVFAARVSDPGDSGTISTTFTLSESISGTAAVYGESRNVTITDGVFTDDFDPEDVHLYEIRVTGSVPVGFGTYNRYGGLRFGTGRYGPRGRF